MLRPVCSGDSPARSARNAVLGEEHSLVPLGLSCIARAIRAQTHIQCMLVCASRSFDIVAHLATLDVVEFICEATSAARGFPRVTSRYWGPAVSMGDSAAHAIGVQWHFIVVFRIVLD